MLTKVRYAASRVAGRTRQKLKVYLSFKGPGIKINFVLELVKMKNSRPLPFGSAIQIPIQVQGWAL